MGNIARSLSPRSEFCLVVSVAFGYFILGNILSILFPSTGPAITNASLRFLVAFELVVLLFLGSLLFARGWRVSRFGPPIAISDVGAASALAFVAYVSSAVAGLAGAAVDPRIAASLESPNFVGNDISIVTLVVASAVNPVFEELLLCGYTVTVLKERRGFWTAVNVTLAIRLACHLYQGAVGVIGIVPLGFVFTYWYARSGRLWPVVIAHAFFDVVGLWPYLAK
jgi:uncharacterized protein